MNLPALIPQDLDDPKLSVNERAQLCCRLARHQENAGDYEAATETLAGLWQGVGARPVLEGLDDETRAEVLLRVGALTGWIGSASQIEGSQEMARDLISESARVFQGLDQTNKAGEARSDLALCYWRAGAYDEARVILEEALDELDQSNVEQRAVALMRQALIEREAKRLNEALRIHNQAVPLIDQITDHLLVAHFHHSFANLLNRLSTAENRPDYVDRALMEYTAASFHFEEAGHERFQACVENNLGYLFGAVRKFDEAHEHLDRAQMLMTRLKDNVHLAQVDETRARVLLAEGRTVEAEKTARVAVLRLEKGDEFSLLAEALTTHGIALAQLHHPKQARTALDRAVNVAEQAGDCEGAGIAALTLIEQLSATLSADEVCATVDRARVLLEKTENTDTVRRLSRSAFQALFLTHRIAAPSDWTNFSLRQSVLRYEGSLITLALNESGGSVTKAARLLGFSHHQSLSAIIATRQKELLTKRLPVRKRRQNLMAHPKRKKKQPN